MQTTTPTPDRHAAARTIQRRIQAKVRYRRRRDRKIAVDWLGRDFDLRLVHKLDGREEWWRWTLVAYDPDRALVRMRHALSIETVVWATDEFWSMLRTGTLVQA